MKKYRAFILLPSILVLVTLAFSQATKEKVTQDSPTGSPLQAKLETQALNMQRLSQLMAATGVRVEQSSIINTGAAYRMMRIRWDGSPKNDSSSTLAMEAQSAPMSSTILQEQKRSGGLPRQRSMELSPDHLLVITDDPKAQLRWYSLIPDPRLVRGEAPGPNNELTGQVRYLQKVDFVVNFPDDESATELRFYQPVWNGREFTLTLINTVQLLNN
jgi:hypothetical protein